MSRKREQLAHAVEPFRGQKLDPFYLAFFDCFNQQRFYEAHDVLEHLWLGQRQASNGRYYQGLIQLAGAFVHLQKNRLQPARALFKLARDKLQKYPPFHEELNVSDVISIIEEWLQKLETSEPEVNPLSHSNPPVLAVNRSP